MTQSEKQIPNPDGNIPKPQIVPISGNPPAGFALEHVPYGAEKVITETCGCHAFDEGLQFYNRLEGFDQYISPLSIRPSSINNLLVIVSSDKAYVYANENLPIVSTIRIKKSCEKNDPIFQDDMAGVTRLDFPGIEPSENSGFMLLLSVGWRRGMFFDYRPLLPQYNISTKESFEYMKKAGAVVLSHLFFTEKFLISKEEWDLIIKSGWFPFVFIPNNLWKHLFDCIKHNDVISHVEEEIHEAFLRDIDNRLASWKGNPHLNPHISVFRDAAEDYKNAKWARCYKNAITEVEGILRRAFSVSNSCKQARKALHQNLIKQEHPRSLLFPDQLLTYLNEVIYLNTDFAEPNQPPTRHTVAHGLVNYNDIGRKQALTLLLLIDHFRYCLG